MGHRPDTSGRILFVGGALPTGPGSAGDQPADGRLDLAAEVAAERRVLTTVQQEDLRAVCADAAAAATSAALLLTPGQTEYQAAALLAGELLERALDPVVLLVAGDERIAAHRHPLPTTGLTGRRAMLLCCARRHGLIASVTRFVQFAPPGPQALRDYSRLLGVEAAFLDATRPGARLGDVFDAGTAAYAANGLPADEWHRHHQGGFSGVQPREFPAHSGSDARVRTGSVLAWNPSGAGWKVEDTCLVTDQGAEPLVHDDQWPRITLSGRHRPAVLERA